MIGALLVRLARHLPAGGDWKLVIARSNNSSVALGDARFVVIPLFIHKTIAKRHCLSGVCYTNTSRDPCRRHDAAPD